MDNYSLSDLAAVTNDGAFGGNNAFVLILLFAMIFGFGGNGFFGNRNNNTGDGFSQFATAASQNELLSGQKFDALSRQINQVGDGLCSSSYAAAQQINGVQTTLGGAITTEGRAIQSQLATCCCENQRNTDALRYDMATQFANTNASTTAQIQKVLDTLAQNKIDALQAEVNTLKTQNMFCGVPKINPYGYGVYPYASGCGCGQNI